MDITTYDETIKNVKTDNKKVDDIVQGVNKEVPKLQEKVQNVNQQPIQLRYYLVKELSKKKTYYKMLLDMEDNVKMYLYAF